MDPLHLDKVDDLLSKDSFNPQILEGFNIYCLINQLARAMPKVSNIIASIRDSNVFKFFQRYTGHIEIAKGEEVMTVYFPIQPVTDYLTPTTKLAFI